MHHSRFYGAGLPDMVLLRYGKRCGVSHQPGHSKPPTCVGVWSHWLVIATPPKVKRHHLVQQTVRPPPPPPDTRTKQCTEPNTER